MAESSEPNRYKRETAGIEFARLSRNSLRKVTTSRNQTEWTLSAVRIIKIRVIIGAR